MRVCFRPTLLLEVWNIQLCLRKAFRESVSWLSCMLGNLHSLFVCVRVCVCSVSVGRYENFSTGLWYDQTGIVKVKSVEA